jgi:hypothetical protein
MTETPAQPVVPATPTVPPTTEPGVPVPDTSPPEEGERYDGGEIPRVNPDGDPDVVPGTTTEEEVG